MILIVNLITQLVQIRKLSTIAMVRWVSYDLRPT